MMTQVEQLKDQVRRCVRSYGYIRVSAVAGLGSKNTLRFAEDAKWNPRLETVEKVLTAIHSGAFEDQPLKRNIVA